MTDADRRFIKLVCDGVDKGIAYKTAYLEDVPNAGYKANAILKDPEIKEGITDLLKSQGITLRKLNNALKKKLLAQKAIVVSKDSEIRFVDDNTAQLDAIKTGYKLLGALRDNNTIIDNRSISFTGDATALANIIKESNEARNRVALDTEGDVV